MGGFALLTVQRPTAPGRWPLVLEWGLPEGLLTRAEGELRLDDDARAELTALPPEPYGRSLGERVFIGEILAALAAARAAFPDRLRLLLSLEDPALGALHWERLAVPKDGDWGAAALDGGLSFARLVPSRSSRLFPLAGAEPRTLAFVSSPPGVTKFPEFSAMEVATAIRETAPQVTFLGTADRPPASLEALMAELQAGDYATLVVVAHGLVDDKDHELLFQNKKREQAPARATEFLAQLHKLPRLPRLVVFLVCDSGRRCAGKDTDLGARVILERGVPAAVAMAGMFTVRSGLPWLTRFLREVHASGDIELAIGRAADAITTHDDAVYPVLSVRLRGHRLYEEGGYVLPSGTRLADLLAVIRGAFGRRAPCLAETVAALTGVLERADATPEQRDRARRELDELCVECLDLGLGALVGGREPAPSPESPFVGLRAFGYDDRGLFFGRERLAASIADRLGKERFLAITGPSGSGKSSLLFAGVIPELQKQEPELNWRSFRPGPLPVEALAKAAAELAATGAATRLLIVDQLEELFTQGAAEDQVQRFLDELIEQSKTTRIALTVRADFFQDCTEHAEFGDLFKRHLEPVRRMTEPELRHAMERQAETAGLRLDDALAGRILEEVRGAAGAMPLVQHLLQEIFQRRRGRWLRTSAYAEVGGVRHALVTTAERLYGSLSRPEQGAVREIVLRLTRPDDHGGSDHRDARRRVELEQVVPAGGSLETTHRLVNRLADATLVVTSKDPVTGNDVVEVAHEELIRSWDRLRGWLDEHRGARLLLASVERAAVEWKAGDRDTGLLVHQGVRLAAVVGVIEKSELRPNKLEADYLDACREFEKRRRRRQLAVGAAIGIGALAAATGLLVMGIVGAKEKDQRQAQETLTALYEAQLHFLHAEVDDRAGRQRDAFHHAAIAAATIPDDDRLSATYAARAVQIFLGAAYPQGRLPVELPDATIHTNGRVIVGTADGRCYLFALDRQWHGGELRAEGASACMSPVVSRDGARVAALIRGETRKPSPDDRDAGWTRNPSGFLRGSTPPADVFVVEWATTGQELQRFEVGQTATLTAAGEWFIVQDHPAAVAWRDPTKRIDVPGAGGVASFAVDGERLLVAALDTSQNAVTVRRIDASGAVDAPWSPAVRPVTGELESLMLAPDGSALIGVSYGGDDSLIAHRWSPGANDDFSAPVKVPENSGFRPTVKLWFVSKGEETIALGNVENIVDDNRLFVMEDDDAFVIDMKDLEIIRFGGGYVGVVEEGAMQILDEDLDDEFPVPLPLEGTVARTITADQRLVVLYSDATVSVVSLTRVPAGETVTPVPGTSHVTLEDGLVLTATGSAGLDVSATDPYSQEKRWTEEIPRPGSEPGAATGLSFAGTPFWTGAGVWGYQLGDGIEVRSLTDNAVVGHARIASPQHVLVVARDRIVEEYDSGLVVHTFDGSDPFRFTVTEHPRVVTRDGRYRISSAGTELRLFPVVAGEPPAATIVRSADGSMLRLAEVMMRAADSVELASRDHVTLLFGHRIVEIEHEGASISLRDRTESLPLAPCPALDTTLALASTRNEVGSVPFELAPDPRWVAFAETSQSSRAVVCDLVGRTLVATVPLDWASDLGWADDHSLLVVQGNALLSRKIHVDPESRPWWIPLAQALSGEVETDGRFIALPPSWRTRLWRLALDQLEDAAVDDSAAAAILRYLDAAPPGVVED